MHLATAEALVKAKTSDMNEVMKCITKKYISSSYDMGGRAPGGATNSAIRCVA